MIELANITKVFDGASGSNRALDDVTLTIESGEIFGIIGESGAGKSTLVRCINLLEQPTSGTVRIDGRDVTDLRGSELRKLRADIGMIFQGINPRIRIVMARERRKCMCVPPARIVFTANQYSNGRAQYRVAELAL